MKKTDQPVVVEQTFSATIETVWKAITERDRMVQWFFEAIPTFEAEVGFETEFNVNSGERDFLHQWRVTEVVPLKKLVYDWKYDQYPGDAYVVWELLEHDHSTKLRLTTIVREDFPDDIPEFKRESCVGGWEYFIKERLKSFLGNS